MTKRPCLLETISTLAFASGGGIGRSKDLIPGKCFLLFQDHGLAHVRPQTQCTIAGAAREERAEGNKIRKRKKKSIWNSECKPQQALQKQAQEETFEMIWVTGITWALLRKASDLAGCVSTLGHCKSLQRGNVSSSVSLLIRGRSSCCKQVLPLHPSKARVCSQ